MRIQFGLVCLRVDKKLIRAKMPPHSGAPCARVCCSLVPVKPASKEHTRLLTSTPSSPRRMRTSCSPCSFSTTSSKDPDRPETCARDECERWIRSLKRVGRVVLFFFCGCVGGSLLERGSRCLCVCLSQEAVNAQSAGGSSLCSWTSTVTFSPS